MKIGVVDLDTSHPQNWIPIERELGHEIVGLWDGGDIHPKGYAKKFAKEHEIPTIFKSLEDMVPEVDCAIIHSCDWDKHLDKARPFVEAGKSVLIDKPMAGTLKDLHQLLEWEAAGVRIAGGSSLRSCYEVAEWRKQPKKERGVPQMAFVGCGVDEFNYGIHAYALLSAIMGPGIYAVQYLSGATQQRIRVNWNDGRMAILNVGAAESWLPFYATIVTGKTVTHLQPDSANLYRSLLEATLPYLAKKKKKPPISMRELIEPELCALAALKSRKESGRCVSLSQLREDDSGYDGAAFAVDYKKTRYP